MNIRRIGRKPTFILSYVGIVLGFSWAPTLLILRRIHNIYLVMLGSLFFLIGGGVPVAINTLNAMASDLGAEGDKYVLSSSNSTIDSSTNISQGNSISLRLVRCCIR